MVPAVNGAASEQDPRFGDRSPSSRPDRVALFVTCLVDELVPEVGEATVRVLRRFGVEVEFRARQTCCGQPAYNAGHRRAARAAAEWFLEVFEGAPAIVAPSGSCVTMVRELYPTLFADDAELRERVRRLGERTWELSQFLTEVLGLERFPGRLEGSVTWHDSCHALRGLGVKSGPRRLLESIEGLRLEELRDADVCCGFGGLFSVKHDGISGAMLADKVRAIEDRGADRIAACDASCLLHIGGGLRRARAAARPLHLAEVLAAALAGETRTDEPGAREGRTA